MKKYLWPILTISVVAVIAAGISRWSNLGYWTSFIVVAAAILMNGFIATVEDDLPGGFNNPDGTDTPKYITYVVWSVRAIIILFVGLCVFVLVLWKYG